MSLENPCTFLLAKENPDNAILTLIVNYGKIIDRKTNDAIQNKAVNCYLMIWTQ